MKDETTTGPTQWTQAQRQEARARELEWRAVFCRLDVRASGVVGTTPIGPAVFREMLEHFLAIAPDVAANAQLTPEAIDREVQRIDRLGPASSTECLCAQIQRADPRRHFKGCPKRTPLPEEDQQAIDAHQQATEPELGTYHQSTFRAPLAIWRLADVFAGSNYFRDPTHIPNRNAHLQALERRRELARLLLAMLEQWDRTPVRIDEEVADTNLQLGQATVEPNELPPLKVDAHAHVRKPLDGWPVRWTNEDEEAIAKALDESPTLRAWNTPSSDRIADAETVLYSLEGAKDWDQIETVIELADPWWSKHGGALYGFLADRMPSGTSAPTSFPALVYAGQGLGPVNLYRVAKGEDHG